MSADEGSAFPDEHEGHENHERYLITYADMITLLMALFIILFAIGQTDLEKYKRFAAGASGRDVSGVLDGGSTLATERAPVEVIEPVEQLGAELRRVLAPHGTRADAVRVEERGVVVGLPADGFAFAPGSVQLTSEGEALVAALATALDGTSGEIVVEGHTDDAPPAPPMTNWSLSVERAVTVVQALARAGVPGERMTAAGHAHTHPVASNATVEGRAANRRVEVVLVVDGRAQPS